MTNEQILRKAIEKAVGNGWKFSQRGFDHYIDLKEGELADYVMKEMLYYPVIFSHSFAKAFWKRTRKKCSYCGDRGYKWADDYDDKGYHRYPCDDCNPNGSCFPMDWKQHLQQMVLEKEPLKYIERFL